jgi:hypothetical protein
MTRRSGPRCHLGLATAIYLGFFAFAASSFANDALARSGADAPRASEPNVDAAMIARWIAELESPSQATRSAAQTELQRAGEAALEQVSAAVRSTKPEVRLRSVEILRRHADGDEPTLAESARVTLQRFAGDGDMGVARAAESAIAASARNRAAEEAADTAQQRVVVRGGGAMIRLRPVVVARAAAVPVAVRSVSVSVINGKRTIHAKNGDEEVEISDGGDDGIKMSITKKVDGKVKKETFAVKDAKELMEKHADAFELYEQYASELKSGARARLVEPPVVADGKAKAVPKLPPVNHTDVPNIAPSPQR